MTIYSVVHTKTVTFYGNKTDYTPPYPTIQTPVYCLESSEESPTTDGFSPHLVQGPEKTTTGFFRALMPFARPQVTFITTDKNPAVVFPSDPPPNYNAIWSDPYPKPVMHKSVSPQDDSGSRGDSGGQGRTSEGSNQPRPTFSLTAKGNEVIINSKTYASLKPDQVTTVGVDGGKFTIYPTAIIGEGATVAKPPPFPTKFGFPSPTEGHVGGLDVSLSGSRVAIAGVAMTMPPHGTTTTIRGQRVTIDAKRIVVGTSSLELEPWQAAPESDVVVAGGEMLTVAGKSVVVVHSKTITYGRDSTTTRQVVGGDTVTIGPLGVTVHGLTLGGSQAREAYTTHEIIGGATVTKIAPSVAIINGLTFTVGPGSPLSTTVIAGQAFTLGPIGVIVSTMTISHPFGATVVAAITPTGTWLNTLPVETASPPGADDDNIGPCLRPSLPCAGVALCIAIGVLVWPWNLV
ncbi:uncharacterized protein MAM_04394 [Metarhizium album ARSEF 1941]|uniref:Uncharacterized protein n=1 Tax=Metarhizium album (strain ARSEF 1941) TaxID=1081103 RepID=A0A0B2WYS3_METAS|nr:uncharacterized protein MAM_04394 [Metarhizium album ARSEF 1941]KHN98005.1 hypothetical protein MAM_04394 [Metarhizium album ARSEF 1941]